MNKDEDKSPKPKSPAPKKVFDVMRPGKAPASPTSRPVIVGHKPQVADDQFVEGAHSKWAGDNPFAKHDLMDAKKKVDLFPAEQTNNAKPTDAIGVEPELPQEVPTREISPDDAVSAPEVGLDELAKLTEELEPPKTPVVTEEPQTAPVVDTEAEERADDQPVERETDKPSVEGLAVEQAVEKPSADSEQQEDASQAKPQVTSDDLAKPANHNDVLASTSAPLLDKVVVSHHKHHTKWWEWLLIILLIIVVGLAALNFLIDAEIIKTNFDVPHTNLLD